MNVTIESTSLGALLIFYFLFEAPGLLYLLMFLSIFYFLLEMRWELLKRSCYMARIRCCVFFLENFTISLIFFALDVLTYFYSLFSIIGLSFHFLLYVLFHKVRMQENEILGWFTRTTRLTSVPLSSLDCMWLEFQVQTESFPHT